MIDPKCMEQFLEHYDRYAEALYRHAVLRVSSHETAENLVQDTFLKTWDYLRQDKKIENMRAFLYRVLNNNIIDHYRAKKEVSLEALQAGEDPFDPPDESMPADTQALINDIVRKLENLAHEDRELLIMRYVDDLEPKEIADVLGITANNVSVRLNRAVEKLKAFI